MEDYKELYYYLFNKITDLIKELEEVQKAAEKMFVEKNDNG